MEQIGEILRKKFEKKGLVRAKYEFQEYGIWLAEQLHDSRHKALYIKLAKEKRRSDLERACIFATEYETGSINRGRLFMWKLKELEKDKRTRTKKSS
ncbi:MAG: hypothetical protein A2126_03345 [Candidatus Woykebacteria bacterium GWB1_45_5]|uniref:Uncharacterized protein n=2 Tax=Candidatus Woykeibacteriota TaxID=1817899 RepID=A0A1G1W173_9BACT|nr:MAG: hypothetical protein A2113_04395 [Candidatus Woykebacteria bacterium GWA1_44_8]OGY24385.1 MAG: hypothetical protein A2126_03345 [Candidatus Woykebacteria bacterium GWB1_45_5]